MSHLAERPAPLPLAELERVLERACGVSLSPGVRQSLLDGFLRAAREAGSGSGPFLRKVLAGDERAVALLVENALVGETYFYRHPEQLAALTRQLLVGRPLERPLAIWSAGCASGEEPYSLSMLLLEVGRGGCGDRILATDVSARALEAARAGRYGEWSLRRIEPTLRRRFFREEGRRLAVTAAVRAPVELRRHNLVADPAPGAGFDLVLCRNVLIYFTPATAAAVLARLVEALRPGGWLLLAPVEVPLAADLGLERLDVPGATLLRRPEGQASGARPTPARRRAEPGPQARAAAPASAGSPEAAPALEPTPCCGPAAGPECRRGFAMARAAARAGDAAAAEALARTVAEQHRCPESYLLVAMAAEARGDDAGAVEAVRRALFLDPRLAQAHAALVPLCARLGRHEEASRARRNALWALQGLDDAAVLRGVEPITAGALRQALAVAPGAPRPAAPGSHG